MNLYRNQFFCLKNFVFFKPYTAKMKNTTDEDKKNMYLRIIVSLKSNLIFNSASKPTVDEIVGFYAKLVYCML